MLPMIHLPGLQLEWTTLAKQDLFGPDAEYVRAPMRAARKLIGVHETTKAERFEVMRAPLLLVLYGIPPSQRLTIRRRISLLSAADLY